MKTLVSTGAIALLLTLTACGPSTPATRAGNTQMHRAVNSGE